MIDPWMPDRERHSFVGTENGVTLFDDYADAQRIADELADMEPWDLYSRLYIPEDVEDNTIIIDEGN